MQKMRVIVLFSFVLLLSAGVIVGHAESEGPPPDKVDAQNQELVQDLEEATQRELLFGESEISEDGSIVPVGKSAERLQILHDETRAKIDELLSRPVDDRLLAIANIEAVDLSPVEYRFTTKSPYDETIPIEIYATENRVYQINAETNRIVQFAPTYEGALDFNLDSKLSPVELEKIAIEFIKTQVPDIEFSFLQPSHTNKNEIVYFFRWEDITGRFENGSHPFIQVGISASGEIGSFDNTLDLVKGDLPSKSTQLQKVIMKPPAKPLRISGDFIMANGGSYWSKTGVSHSTRPNDGYCYYAGWCSPKNFYYVAESSTVTYTGKWNNPNYAQYSNVYAYVPWINATAVCAHYKISYYYGTFTQCIPQTWYSNTFVLVTDLGRLYTVTIVKLVNSPAEGSASSSRDVAFDEIDIVY